MPHPVVLGLVDDVGPMVQLLTGHIKWGRDLSKPIRVGEGTGNGRRSFLCFLICRLMEVKTYEVNL